MTKSFMEATIRIWVERPYYDELNTGQKIGSIVMSELMWQELKDEMKTKHLIENINNLLEMTRKD